MNESGPVLVGPGLRLLCVLTVTSPPPTAVSPKGESAVSSSKGEEEEARFLIFIPSSTMSLCFHRGEMHEGKHETFYANSSNTIFLRFKCTLILLNAP